MAEKKSYKDYTGSSDYLGKIIDSLNSGQTKVITSRNVTGTIGTDEGGAKYFQPFLSEQEGGGSARALTPAEMAQAKYNPDTDRVELTVPVAVAPYIDTSKIPGFPIENWPVQVLGDGTYKLSSMNNSETGYANVAFQTDATGRAKTITEANPASFENYDKGNFLSNFAGAVGDFASSDAAKLLALGAGAMTFGPGLLGETAAGAAGSGAAPTIDSLASSFYGVPEGSAYVAPTVGPGVNLASAAPAAGTSIADLGVIDVVGTKAAPSILTPANVAGAAGAAGVINAANNATKSGTSTTETPVSDAGVIDVVGQKVVPPTVPPIVPAVIAGAAAGSILNPGGSTPAPVTPAKTTTPTTDAAAAGAGGATLASLLTPENALIAKAILDAIGGNQVADAISGSAATQQAAYESSKGTLGDIANYVKQVQAPYQSIGSNAANNLGALGTGSYQMYDASGKPTTTGTGSGYFQKQFDASDLAKGLAPNYDFMLQQGQMANQRAANVGGGALGGNALTGLNRYTQDYAGTAYQNAFKNYQDQRQNIFGNLKDLAGIGQNSTGQLSTAAGNYGTNLTNLNVGNAAAQAAAQVARAQTQGNTLSNLTNTGFLATLLNQKPAVAPTT
jgi:hypothetical protein